MRKKYSVIKSLVLTTTLLFGLSCYHKTWEGYAEEEGTKKVTLEEKTLWGDLDLYSSDIVLTIEEDGKTIKYFGDDILNDLDKINRNKKDYRNSPKNKLIFEQETSQFVKYRDLALKRKANSAKEEEQSNLREFNQNY